MALVVSQKDFKGLEESTYISRAFSDQGVRLRLRKEQRNASKRSFAEIDDNKGNDGEQMQHSHSQDSLQNEPGPAEAGPVQSLQEPDLYSLQHNANTSNGFYGGGSVFPPSSQWNYGMQ
jgi:velvet factor protein